ncbi:MAG: DUF2000 domain-containing protein [Firmicutes bacterium]|nr:DUF2000 domain-containing protein [Bacillota bacterium]
MNYEDKKIVGIVATNVEPSIALNVIGHCAIAIGKWSGVEIMGKPEICDKTGVKHRGVSKFPFIITKVKAGKLRNAIDLAKQNPNLLVVDYPKEVLTTRTDEELVSAIENKDNAELEYLGAIIYGDTKDVNEITGKFQLWKVD